MKSGGICGIQTWHELAGTVAEVTPLGGGGEQQEQVRQ